MYQIFNVSVAIIMLVTLNIGFPHSTRTYVPVVGAVRLYYMTKNFEMMRFSSSNLCLYVTGMLIRSLPYVCMLQVC